MHKGKVLTIIVFSLLLTGCTKKAPDTTIEKKLGESQEEFTGKMKAAVALGVPFECTYKNEDIESIGYIKGKKYYTSMKAQDGKDTFIIMKDKCMWSWVKGLSQGTKICFEEDIWDMENQPNTPNNTEYSCTSTNISNSQFDPPSNINFLDIKEQMGKYQP